MEEVAAARQASNWDQIELLEDGAVKRSDSANLDLRSIAHAYAVDRSADTLIALQGRGGVVRLGGNLRCFGRREDDALWPVDVLDPFAPRQDKALLTLAVGDGAVCTHSQYYNYVVINGRSYRRILNPATGWPVSGVASATVVAPSCLQAAGWATALSVLGEGGLKLLPPGVEAMVVVGTPKSSKILVSDGFQKYRARQANKGE
jgi:thiamine biosynthesis lipoprotein